MGHIAYRSKLDRLTTQLNHTQKLLKRESRLVVLQTVLQALRLQAEWKNAAPIARLLFSFEIALHAQEREKSQTGFIGPALDQWLRKVVRFMQVNLSRAEAEVSSLLLPLTEAIAIGSLMITVYLMEKGKRTVPQEDRAAAQLAAQLYRELGLIFLIGTRAIAGIFESVAHAMGCNKKTQQRVAGIGMSVILSLLIVAEQSGDSCSEEFLETMMNFLKPHLQNVEVAIREGRTNGILEEEPANALLLQLQAMRHMNVVSLEEPLRVAFQSAFEAFGLSYEEVKQDVKRLKEECKVLVDNFNFIFNQTKMTATTVIHAA